MGPKSAVMISVFGVITSWALALGPQRIIVRSQEWEFIGGHCQNFLIAMIERMLIGEV